MERAQVARASVAWGLAALAVGLVFGSARRTTPAPHPAAPHVERLDGYVGSGACQSCHPSQSASFERTYHRTMTQRATPATVRAPLPARLELEGRTFELSAEAERLFVTGPSLHQVAAGLAAARGASDPQAARRRAWANAARVRREVVLVTGSHHYQAYWVEGGEGRELRQLPFVYRLEPDLADAQRWLPREAAFLQPPDAPPHIARWNANCIQCHSVAGRPRETEPDGVARYDSSVVDLGIQCESCHGPGGAHVRAYQNPLRRVGSAGAASAIVNPARLDAERGSAVCGQCHSYFLPHDPGQWWESGFAESFRAGDALEGSRTVLDYARDREAAGLLSRDLESVFWPDGTLRVGGREYNGLTESPCYERGAGERQLRCTSCHSMHGAPPDDQLRPAATGNGACTQCHTRFEAPPALTAHTRHPAQSSGSLCYNCHMPLTTYALLKGIRSHRVTSPQLALTAPTSALEAPPASAPNACNLCHLDRTERWAAVAWSEQAQLPGVAQRPDADPGAPSSPASAEVPAAVRWLVAGDAAQRALIAYAMGWAPAHAASGASWLRPLLADAAARDPYAAVRFIAERSLRQLPQSEPAHAGAPTLLPAALEALRALRNDTPITISE